VRFKRRRKDAVDDPAEWSAGLLDWSEDQAIRLKKVGLVEPFLRSL
jgi:hypothetical protein